MSIRIIFQATFTAILSIAVGLIFWWVHLYSTGGGHGDFIFSAILQPICFFTWCLPNLLPTYIDATIAVVHYLVYGTILLHAFHTHILKKRSIQLLCLHGALTAVALSILWWPH